jgi:hypothetical protein
VRRVVEGARRRTLAAAAPDTVCADTDLPFSIAITPGSRDETKPRILLADHSLFVMAVLPDGSLRPGMVQALFSSHNGLCNCMCSCRILLQVVSLADVCLFGLKSYKKERKSMSDAEEGEGFISAH